MNHSEKMEFITQHPMMKNKDLDHSEIMKMIEECPMMQDKDHDASGDHDHNH